MSTRIGSILTLAAFGFCAAAADQVPAAVYAATSRGIYKSLDGGASWQDTSGILANSETYALAIDPLDGATVIAGLDNEIRVSHDAGQSWTVIPMFGRIVSLAVDGFVRGRIFAAGQVLWKTLDAGKSWTAVAVPRTPVFHVAFDPLVPDTLYAGVSGGILKSIDGGNSWNEVRLPRSQPNWDVREIFVDPSLPSNLYL